MKKKNLADMILGQKGAERRISAMTAIILLVTVLATGMAIFYLFARQLHGELEKGLERTLGDKIALVHGEIEDAGESAAGIAQRFLLARLLKEIGAGSAPPEAAATLAMILDNAMREHGLTGIELFDSRGRQVAARGVFPPDESFLPLQHPAGAALHWHDGHRLNLVRDIHHDGSRVGTLRLEKPLPVLDRVFRDYQGLGKTGESVLCGALSAEQMRCFPSRHRPEPFESARHIDGVPVPLSLALEGKSGVIIARDYRGQEVFDAYRPIGDSGLGMVVKIDTAELYRPVRAHLLWIVPFLAALAAIGFALLRWQVGPLVRDVLHSRWRMHAIFDNSADGLITIDGKGIIESFNPAAARIFGYTAAEVQGRSITLLMPEAYRARHETGLQRYLDTGQPRLIGSGAHEVEGQRKDGSVFPMEITLGEMGLDGERLFIGSVRDTSALKQAHDQLKASFSELEGKNRELEETHDQLMDAKLENDLQMEALAEANVRMVLYHSTMERVRHADASLSASGDMNGFYLSILNDLMALTSAQYGAVGLFDANGHLTQFLTEGISEEERKKIGPYPAGKGMLEAFYKGNTLTRVSRIAEDPRACGFPPGHPAMTSLLGAPLQLNGMTQGVIYLADKNGGDAFTDQDEMLVEMLAREIEHILERGKLLASLRDSNQALSRERAEQQNLIAKLQEAQNQLLQSEKMASIGQLAAGVAHEINNPIGYVHSNLGTLEKYVRDLFSVLDQFEAAEGEFPANSASLARIRAYKDTLDLPFLKEDIPTLMNESKEGITRVKKIVQDLKDFSHVDEAEWQWCDLHGGLDSTLNIVWNELKYKAEVVKEYGTLPEIECIPSQLNQVFMNLLVNAGHAIEDRGTITIRTGQDGDDVWVEVADTGKGIAPEHLGRIFDPFFTTKPVGKGTGLGLSLSYGIVKKHHGEIEVKSELGKGTTFRVHLPLKQVEKAS